MIYNEPRINYILKYTLLLLGSQVEDLHFFYVKFNPARFNPIFKTTVALADSDSVTQNVNSLSYLYVIYNFERYTY